MLTNYHWTVVKGDGERMLVTGPVYIPREVDTQGEAATKEQIEEMAHAWFLAGSALKVDVNHNHEESGSVAVESHIVREDWPHPQYPVGTWLVTTLIRDETLKADIRSGKINGYSFEGSVDRTVHVALIRHPVEASGTTEKSEGGPYPAHVHQVHKLAFDSDGRVIPTETEPAFGHTHQIIGTTHVERAADHGHGYRLVQGEGNE